LEERPDNRVVLFATYLFPFCAAVEMAARILFRFRERVDCVLNPAGSDIWQIGRQMPHVARQLIDSQYVTAVVTYSECFAREIQANIGCDRVIDVIPPAIDIEKFRPLSAPDRTAARQSLGIAQGDFVIVHCSNHRPVKGLSHLVELASHFASRRDEVIHLIMIGPITSHLSEVVKLAGLPEPGDVLPYHAQLGNLRIACTGLRHDVHRLQAIGDVAVNTSLHDSFNISLAEAMACQIPPLTTDVAGIASTIRAYDCGGTIPFENNPVYSDNAISLTGQSIIRVDAAVAWLENIASDPEGRLAFGKRARQAIVATCSDSVVARKWSELVGLR
jgi:glycosyltransferase involved in cell wall biosynthesis